MQISEERMRRTHPFGCVYEEDNPIWDPDTRRDFIREVYVALKRQDFVLVSGRTRARIDDR